MIRKNLFDGDCDFAAFAQIAYKLLMTREWVTYKSIMDICYPKINNLPFLQERDMEN